MRLYTPITRDIRTERSPKNDPILPKSFYGNQYEMTFDVQADSHLRSLLKRENKSSLCEFINS